MLMFWNLCCFTGETPLLHAARQGHTATAKYLIECGANPTLPSELGATALHHSAGIGVNVILFFFPFILLLISRVYTSCFKF